ncbi:MAG: hypothetical protein KDA60_11220 [Planctomycetales bacterium]|nr:hypothetical protein [Planctomycetales bacterium]
MKEKKLAFFVGLGGGPGENPERRTWNWGVREHGFEPHFERLREQYHQGIEIFISHLPAGRNKGEEVMDFDGFVEVHESAERGLLPPDVERRVRWSKYTEALTQFLEDCPHAEHHTYLGSLPNDDDLVHLKRTDTGGYLRRVVSSLYPVMAATRGRLHDQVKRNGIMFDQICGGRHQGGLKLPSNYELNVPAGSPEHYILELVRSLGHPVTIEPHPWDDPRFEHLYNFDVIVMWEHWQQAGFAKNAKSKITGRIFGLQAIGGGHPEWIDGMLSDPFIDIVTVGHADIDYARQAVERHNASL